MEIAVNSTLLVLHIIIYYLISYGVAIKPKSINRHESLAIFFL